MGGEAPQVHPDDAPRFDEDELNLAAHGAAGHSAGCAQVDAKLREQIRLPAGRAGAARHCHLVTERGVQGAGDRVPVECLHRATSLLLGQSVPS